MAAILLHFNLRKFNIYFMIHSTFNCDELILFHLRENENNFLC